MKGMDDVHKMMQLISFYQLISKITEIQREDLQGCVMTSAKFVCMTNGKCENYQNQVRIEHESERGMAILAQGIDDTGEIVQSLNVKLLKRKNEPEQWNGKGKWKEKKDRKEEGEKNINFPLPYEGVCRVLRISERQVEEYLQKTGDTNVIHRGERAVVPGLCIVSACFDSCKEVFEKYVNMQVKFFKPVYVGEMIQVYDRISHRGKQIKRQMILIVTNDSLAVEILFKNTIVERKKVK